jgi:hypothetical protein
MYSLERLPRTRRLDLILSYLRNTYRKGIHSNLYAYYRSFDDLGLELERHLYSYRLRLRELRLYRLRLREASRTLADSYRPTVPVI